MSGFARALPFVLEREGGYVDHPADRGGATNKGVTQDAYDAWRVDHGLSPRDVQEITDEEVASVFHERYWVEAHCDAWWWPLSLAVFDAAVNHGPTRAIKLLQSSARTTVDGIVGPQTHGAIAEMDRTELLNRLRWKRLIYYGRIVRDDPSQAAFIVGWIRRVWELEKKTKVAA